MKRINITLDEETLNLLPVKGNTSETIRQAVKVYHQYISPDGKKNLVQVMVDQREIARDMLEKVTELEAAIFDLNDTLTKMKSRMGGSWAD